MTLATQCPHCNTSFRIAESQLAAHNGLVRCGVCTRVFNGNDFLTPNDTDTASDQVLFDETVAATQAEVVDVVTVAEAETPVSPAAPKDTLNVFRARPETPDVTTTPLHADTPAPEEDWHIASSDVTSPLSTASTNYTPEDPSALRNDDNEGDALIIEEDAPDADLTRFDVPASQAGTHNEPSFIKANRRRQRIGKILRICMAIAALPLLVAALGQGVYLWRHQIAMAFPQAKPLLVAACATLRCKVGLSTDIEQLSLESNELETLPGTPDTFALSVLLRNNAQLPQAWPHIELTLNDRSETPLIKRVFTPQEYLPASHPVADGFQQHSEQQVTVRFTLNDAVASGYRVYLFYP
jgi:predicted Zn finger-like uncharacterized protein